MFANGGTAPGNVQYTQSADRNADKVFDEDDIATLDVLEGSDPADDMNGDDQVDLLDAVQQVQNIRALKAHQEGNPDNKLAGFVYDGLGNTLQTPDGETYSYDGWGRLILHGGVHRVQYDAEGKRAATWSDLTPNDKTYVLYDEKGKPLAEYSWDGLDLTLTQEHFYFGGSQIASDVHNPNTGCPERIWIHSDHLGSPRQFSDASGAFIGYKDYYAFGDHWDEDTDCLPLSVDYTGHQSTSSSDLVWMQARTYNSKYGRFLQPDPVKVTEKRLYDPQQLVLFAYVRNNPLVYVDPTGKDLTIHIYGTNHLRKKHWTEEQIKSYLDGVRQTYLDAGVKVVKVFEHKDDQKWYDARLTYHFKDKKTAQVILGFNPDKRLEESHAAFGVGLRDVGNKADDVNRVINASTHEIGHGVSLYKWDTIPSGTGKKGTVMGKYWPYKDDGTRDDEVYNDYGARRYIFTKKDAKELRDSLNKEDKK